MALAIIITIGAILGIIQGISKKRNILVVISVAILIIIAVTMLYFYKNPY